MPLTLEAAGAPKSAFREIKGIIEEVKNMRIINLIENTEGICGCTAAHGLSFYIETEKHRILSDLGPSEETLKNAKALGIDPESIDLVVLSHGHYDHSGGIMAFAEINPKAKICMQKTAPGPYYADRGEGRMEYIGIDSRIGELPSVMFADGDLVIDEELSVFQVQHRICEPPSSNKRIRELKEGEYILDPFSHEQFLVIQEKEKKILVSGCAHTGILNIMNTFTEKYGCQPAAVISGFHLMKKTEYTEEEREEIRKIANALLKYDTIFYTCHCTGIPAFEEMKAIMGPRLHYVHCGEEIDCSVF